MTQNTNGIFPIGNSNPVTHVASANDDTIAAMQKQLDTLKAALDAQNATSPKVPGDGATVANAGGAVKGTVPSLKGGNATYPFDDGHVEEWGAGGIDNTTPIAISWARLSARGIHVGSPLGAQYVNKAGITRQSFQYAYAAYEDDNEVNVNKIVEFYDARGLVGTESGL